MNHHPPLPARLILRRTTRGILRQTTSAIFSTPTNLLLLLVLSLFLLSLRANVEIATHFLTSFIDNNPSIKSIIDRNNAPPKPQFTATSFPNFESDNRIRASTEILPSSSTESQTYWFDLENDEFTAIIIFVLAFTASYWIMIHVFVDTYSKVHGIIFELVLDDFYRRPQSFHLTFSTGSTLGLEKLTGFITIRWVIRNVFNQLICFWFYRGIDDPYSFLNFFIKSKYMSFSIMTPWDETFQNEIFVFIVSCFLLDMVMSLVFAMGVWMVLGGSKKNNKDVVKEGCYLVSLMIRPAIELKCYECIVCGAFARLVVATIFGDLFAIAFQSLMEVYFLVAWMVYYVSVKGNDGNSSGLPFGQREIEVMFREVRGFLLSILANMKW